MKRVTSWTTAVAVTALLAGPVVVSAQQPAEPQPPSQQPASPQQPTPTEPGQPAPPTPRAEPAQPESSQQVDAEAVKRHLTAARDALSQMTQMPAAAQLAGDARTHVSQLITNFNELITTNVEWRASYAKVTTNLNALVGDQRADESPAAPTTATPGAVGTSGTTALDPALKAKLVEFKTHLLEFEKAAGGKNSPSASASSSVPASAATADPPPSATIPGNTAAAGSTSTPPTSVTSSAAAAATAVGTAGTTAPAQTAGTSGSTTPAPAGSSAAAASAPDSQSRSEAPKADAGQAADSQQGGHAEALRHIDAIETILKSATAERPAGTAGSASRERAGSIDGDQAEQIRQHLAELRRLLSKSNGQ